MLLPGDYSKACSPAIPAPGEARLVFVESGAFLGSGHHVQKLALHLASARLFAAELRREGHDVEIVQASSVASALAHAARGGEIVAQAPATRLLEQALRDGAQAADAKLRLLPETRFIATREAFAEWARARPRAGGEASSASPGAGEARLSVDHWYRDLRIEQKILMEPLAPTAPGKKRRRASKKEGDDEDGFAEADAKAKERELVPFGGRWIPSGRADPVPPREAWPEGFPGAPQDGVEAAVFREALAEAAKAPNVFGESAEGLWPASRASALAALDAFVTQALAGYHKLEDAMLSRHPLLYHSRLSAALNLGLLHPREVARRVEAAALSGSAPPAAAEAYLRNLLGAREFAHGFYWYAGEKYASLNHLGAKRPLPDFLENTDYVSLACVKRVVGDVLERGYAPPHQRLMVLSNFATLTGIDPLAFARWMERAFVDGVEWAALPLSLGLGTFADGGRFSPKPYVTAAAYVAKHSNYCGECGYDPEARSERRACPLNYLYWNFVAEKEPLLRGNAKMTVAYRILGEFGPDARVAAKERANEFLASLMPLRALPELSV